MSQASWSITLELDRHVLAGGLSGLSFFKCTFFGADKDMPISPYSTSVLSAVSGGHCGTWLCYYSLMLVFIITTPNPL